MVYLLPSASNFRYPFLDIHYFQGKEFKGIVNFHQVIDTETVNLPPLKSEGENGKARFPAVATRPG